MTPGDPDACRVYRDNHGRDPTRLDGLVDRGEYFVVLVTPNDPDSFVGISSIIRWNCPAPHSPSPIIVKPPKLSSSQPPNPKPKFPSNIGISPEGDMDSTGGPGSFPPSSPVEPTGTKIQPPTSFLTDKARIPLSYKRQGHHVSGRSPNVAPSPLGSKSNSDISTTPAKEPAAAGSPPVPNNPRPTSFSRCFMKTPSYLVAC